jgi:hypothetical protein
VLPGLRDGAPNQPMPLDDFKAAVAYTHQHRAISETFDVVMFGVTPGDDSARAAEVVTPYAEAGATWWEEGINPLRFDQSGDRPALDAMRERIHQGPPRT